MTPEQEKRLLEFKPFDAWNNNCSLTNADFKELLFKYIKFVGEAEGVDYICGHIDLREHTDTKFTDQEWEVLVKLSKRARK